jgi:hypothetical protein
MVKRVEFANAELPEKGLSNPDKVIQKAYGNNPDVWR